MRARPLVLAAFTVSLAACAAEERAPQLAAADPACFGGRVLSYDSLTAEVVIPPGETCDSGSFIIVFTRGADTLATLSEPREGTVGFIGTADVNGDGRGDFFVATSALSAERNGVLHAYTDSPEAGPLRLPIIGLDSAQRAGYAGGDFFGFGGTNQLVRSFARSGGDTAWFAYSFTDQRWTGITRPDWLR